MVVEGFTVYYDRSGEPEKGVIIGSLPDQGRTMAFIDAGPDELRELQEIDLPGMEGAVRFDPENNCNWFRL